MKIYHIRLNYLVERLIRLPRFGTPAVRGILGYALKAESPEAYEILFGKSENGYGIKPYAIDIPPTDKLVYHPGDTFLFDLYLFGDIKDKIRMQSFTFIQGMKIGDTHGKLRFINAVDLSNHKSIVLSDIKNVEPLRFSPLTTSNVIQIDFLTPISIKHLNDFEDFSFSYFVQRMTERVRSIGFWEEGGVLDTDFSTSGSVQKVFSNHISYDVKHYSRYRKSYIHYKPAFIGSIRFAGDFRPFVRLMQITQKTGIGRGTSSGLGRFTFRFL